MNNFRWTLLTLAAALLSSPALAQDDDGTTIRVEKPSITMRSDCERPLGLCLRDKTREEASEKPARKSMSGTFDKLTRVAGMFMGRVEAAKIGAFRLRVKLDLR